MTTTTPTTDNENENDDDIPCPPDADDDYDRNHTVLNIPHNAFNTRQIMQRLDQEEVDAWYIFNRNNMQEQERLTSASNCDAPCCSQEWLRNRRDGRTVGKLEEKRVEREEYLVRKYSADVILRKWTVADYLNAKNNGTTINNNCNNNNTASTNSWGQCREARLTSNGTFSSHNYQLETARLAEEVRVREQNNNC